MKIKKWIRDGNGESLEDLCQDTDELIAIAGRRMDKAYAQDIMGDVLFEGEDGKTYVGVISFKLVEASPEYVQTILEEEE
jgi:secreted trypsin-like serine protease